MYGGGTCHRCRPVKGHRLGSRLVIARLLVISAAALLVVFADARVSPPAAAGATRWIRTTGHLSVGGRDRTYLTVRPADRSTTRLPVLVVLHGRTMNPFQMEQVSGFLPAVGPAIAVYPAGYRDSWNAGACCGEAHTDQVDDVGFLTGLVHHVLATEPDASPTHVYLAGYSNGGRMALRLACEAPQLFAAVASVEAVPVAECPHPRPVSLLEVASADDPLLALDATKPEHLVNGFHEPNVDGLVAGWRQSASCKDDPTTTVTGSLTLRRWTGCRAGTRVAYAFYQGGSHAWPAGGPDTPSAAQVIWTFFRGPGAAIT